MYQRHPDSYIYTEIHWYTDWIRLQKSTGLDLRVFEDAITFKIALWL